MKLTALAVVILALGIVLGLAIRATVTEAAPPWATRQFVDDSIETFNQAVVQPIAAAVTDLDQRVTALETAPPPQQREDQVVIAIGDFFFNGGDVDNFRSISSEKLAIGLDASRYPASATFRLEVGIVSVGSSLGLQEGCVRLFDTAGTPVSGSELCWSFPVSEEVIVRLRSNAFSLPASFHEYDVQGTPLSGGPTFFIKQTRIIVEWTE